MTKLNWEKANKAEKPREKRRISNRTKVLAAYANGTQRERERIIKLIQDVVAEHQARGIQNVPSLLLLQLIEDKK